MDIEKKLVENNELKKIYNIILPVELINSKINDEAKKMQQNYKLDGFRVGKVPIDLIKKKETEPLFFRTSDNLINKLIFDIVDENKYELALQPKVDIKIMENNKDIEFTVIYELLPNIPDIDFKKIKLDQYKINIGDEEINESINKILSTYKKWIKKEGKAEIGNSVKINFLGKINGEEFAGGKGEDYQLELGSHSFIDNFEEQLVGKKIDDEILVNVTFPDNYHQSSLAGKPATFEVKILEVLQSENNELNDEFVKSTFNIENVEKFKEVITKELEKTYNILSKNKIKSKLFKELENTFDFAVPEGILNEQFEQLKKDAEKSNLNNNKKEDINEEALKKEANNMIKIGLILSKIGKEKGIVVSDNEITEEIMKNAMSMPGYEKMFIDFYKKNKQAVENLKGQILEDKVLDYIINNIDKNEISINIKEFEKLTE